MEWLFTFLIVAVVVVVYVAVQKNSPANRQARAANEALSRVATAWDRAPADQRNHILLEVGVDSASARNTVIVKPWAQLGIQLQTTIALRSGLVEQFLGNSSEGMGQGGTTGDRQGIYSPKAISLLTNEIARIQIGLSAEKAPVPSSENGPDGKVSPTERAEIDPRLDPDQYPTPERIKELWEAWEKGPEALLQALKHGAQEDKIQENLPQQVKQGMEGPSMFGFGRKAEKDRMKPTAAMVEGYSAVKMKFPGVIPRSGTAIGDLAFEIAGDLSNRFSRATFERVRQGWAFSPGWTESDALSRWYALGFICLMNCLQNSQWTEALTLDAGLKVHDAATELLWVLWSPPEPVKEKVRTFMRENIKEITRSLDAFSIPASRRGWFINYVERIKGTNPTWDTRGGFLSQVLAGEQPSTDMLSGNLLMSCFGDARKSILDLVSGARTGISFSNLPAGG